MRPSRGTLFLVGSRRGPFWEDDSSSGSSVDLHAPAPIRPRLPSRKSSGTMIVPRDSDVGPVEMNVGPDDVRHAKALQDSLVVLFNRIEAVKEEHDKLDNNNKFLQKYIGDLMTTSKITATTSKSKK
ncbi:hypothetical protein B0T16DRAFT_425383 [Cercophora newfieldiana]|uniref:Short coiled-coil protein n=1 Tax=Cercophora newfieldiana TaxID=92897 RepID=A0AA39YQV6_9PEZI|nr:hypothetical protein B0T16DRAFT_425383 [Cercophora newfieldiana]